VQIDAILAVEWRTTPPLVCKGAQLQPPPAPSTTCPGSHPPAMDKGAQLDLQTPMRVI